MNYMFSIINKFPRIISYSVFIVSVIVIYLFTVYGMPIVGKTAAYLFFIFIVTLNAWLGGLLFALSIMAYTIALHSTAFFLLRFNPTMEFEQISMFETLIFVATSAMVGYVVEIYRKTDLLSEYRKKREEYNLHIQHLTIENNNLQKEIKLRDEFLSIASHELKTPLTSMLLKIQVALHSVRNVSLAKFSVQNLLNMLETAEQQVQRLGRMINDLLNVSLITTGKLDLEVKEADLNVLVRDVINEFAEKLQKGGYHLTIDAKEPVMVTIDKVRIEQVVTNLLSNAIKYGNGKPIEVGVKNGHGTAKLMVRDHGIGIDAESKEQIFGLFERGTRDKKLKGLGVGLYIANQIVRAHNGRVQVTSRKNQGSTFIVELPVIRTN